MKVTAVVAFNGRTHGTPAAVVEGINQAQAERAAEQAQVDSAPARTVLDRAEVYAMIDSLGDVGAVLGQGKPERLAQLYRALDVASATNTATALRRVVRG